MDVQTDNATLAGGNDINNRSNYNSDLYLDDLPPLVPAEYPYNNNNRYVFRICVSSL